MNREIAVSRSQVRSFADLALQLAVDNNESWDSKPYIKCVREYTERRDSYIRTLFCREVGI